VIKTPHRMLHDALSKEDYARVLVNMREEHGNLFNRPFYIASDPLNALDHAFYWHHSNEGPDYWRGISDKVKAAL